MKEIKFRAWDETDRSYNKDSTRMMSVESINFRKKQAFCCYLVEGSGDSCEWLKLKNVELMQYIGLKDKNEKEIFQNDLVKRDGDDRVYKVFFDWDGARPFHADSLMSSGKGKDVSMDFLPIKMPEAICKYWEIIGNIYENPELLK